MKIKKLSYLLFPLLVVSACDTGPEPEANIVDDIEDLAELEDVDDEATEEIEAGRVAAAQFGRPDDSETEAEIESMRHRSCDTERTRDTRPKGYVMARARGLDDPGFRLQEDQAAAARELASDDDTVLEAPARVAEGMSDAQARYLAEKDELAPDARAMRKEALLGE